MEKPLDYKDKIFILRLSRKMLASNLGLSYASLNARLGGFTPFQEGEEKKLQELLAEAEKQAVKQ